MEGAAARRGGNGERMWLKTGGVVVQDMPAGEYLDTCRAEAKGTMRGRAAATQVPSKIGNVVKVGVTRPTHCTLAYLPSGLFWPAHCSALPCSAQPSPARLGSSAGLHLAGARSNRRPQAGRQTLRCKN